MILRNNFIERKEEKSFSSTHIESLEVALHLRKLLSNGAYSV